jgi:4-amino-4-deoxy-L-arabinose transferase-like glycosyltransferase
VNKTVKLSLLYFHSSESKRKLCGSFFWLGSTNTEGAAFLNFSKNRLFIGLPLILIFLLGAYLRFDFLVSVNHLQSHDTVNYDIMVRQLLDKGIYGYKSTESNAQVSPGFPLFMAAVYTMTDYKHHDPFTTIRYLQACFSLITLWLIYVIAKRLHSNQAGIIAVIIAAFYPPFIWANGAILTEILATLLYMTYLYLQLVSFEKNHRGAALGAGIVMGFTVLVRPEFLIIFPATYMFHLLWHRKVVKMFKLAFFAGIGLTIILSPWVIRNIITLHEPIIASTQVNPFAAGTYPNKNYDDGLVDRHGKTQMEVAKERLKIGFTRHTWEFAKWYTVGKLNYIYGKMFYGSGHRPFYPVIPFRGIIHRALVFLALIAAMVILRRWKQPASLIVVLLLIMSIVRLAFVPEYRYNFTAMPSLIIMDGILLSFLLRWLNKKFNYRSRLKLAWRR